MIALHPEFVVNGKAEKRAVLLPITEWKRLMEDMEELEDIGAYDKAKAKRCDAAVPFEEAVRQIKGRPRSAECSRGFRLHGMGTERMILEHFNLIRIRATASFVVSPVRGVFSDAFDSALHNRPLRGSLRTRRALTSQNSLTPPAEHPPQKEDTDFHKML